LSLASVVVVAISIIQAQSYQIPIEILLNFHHFIENLNTQSLLHKMNDDKVKLAVTVQLMHAIEENDTATASSLISSGIVNLNRKPLLLHRAAQLGRVEIMSVLLDAGADINAVDRFQQFACHFAIFENHFDALKLLVERGANLGVVDSNGNSLLSTVARRDRDERFAILLLGAGAPLDGLSKDHLMLLVTSVAVFNRFLARGVNFSAVRDEIGRNLCHYVARNLTREDDLRFLVNVFGNDAVHAVDNRGWTPLHWASSNGNDSAMRVLVEFGAEIDRQDNNGWTALITAIAIMQPSCVELLLALGADVVTNNGETACHRAVLYDNPDSLTAVVAAGGDLDQPSNKCETPRTIAALRNVQLPTADEVVAARHRIAKSRLDLVRERAFQICVGLQSFRLNALQLCEILMHSFGAIGALIAFHQWWEIATKVKHFRDHKQQSSRKKKLTITDTKTKDEMKQQDER
jgi:ankyrin repeat protein